MLPAAAPSLAGSARKRPSADAPGAPPLGSAQPPATQPAATLPHESPAAWWAALVADIRRGAFRAPDDSTHAYAPRMLLPRLTLGVEAFRIDVHRGDGHLGRIWLAYLETHYAVYGDAQEVKRLHRFLRTERVAADSAEMHTHYARFELLACGRPEKAAAALEAAPAHMAACARALAELRSAGTITLEPLLPTAVSPGAGALTPPSSAPDRRPADYALGVQKRSESSHALTPAHAPAQRRDDDENATRVVVSPRRALDGRTPRTERTASSRPADDMSLASVVSSPHAPPARRPRTDAPQDDATGESRPADTSADARGAPSRGVRVNGVFYRVLGLVGRGGSSRVFKVLAPDGTIYAIKKVALRNLDDATHTGYLNEIAMLRRFATPTGPEVPPEGAIAALSLAQEASPGAGAEHIIRLVDHEWNREHAALYMVMEYGEADLGRMLRARRAPAGADAPRLDVHFVRWVWAQMLRAVRAVHAAKVVHCDLKPANFVLVGGTLKLIDFGISKAIQNDTTNIVRENQVGTLNYMSPEALQESSSAPAPGGGKIKIGRASDVWSLGCILYEMAYGRPPFAHFTLIQRLHRIVDTAYEIPMGPLPDTAAAPWQPLVADVLRRCLQRHAKARASIDELLAHAFLAPPPQPGAPGPAPALSREQVLAALGPDRAVVSRAQLFDIVAKLGRHIPHMDVHSVAERIFGHWQRHPLP